MLYPELFKQLEAVRWNMDSDIPWDKFDASKLTDEQAQTLRDGGPTGHLVDDVLTVVLDCLHADDGTPADFEQLHDVIERNPELFVRVKTHVEELSEQLVTHLSARDDADDSRSRMALAIVGGIAAQGQNVAFLVALAFAVAASANLPTILYSLFWRRFTTRGAVWSMYGGLLSAIILIVLSPVMSGTPTSMIPGADFAVFPLKNPGIVSIPLAFFLGWLGSVTSSRAEDPDKQAEMEVRSLTGIGAEKPVQH